MGSIPPRESAEHLRFHFELNQIDADRYRIHEIGLGGDRGRANIHSPNPFNSGANRLVEDGAGSVTLDTLDNVYTTAFFDLIKIDVEGMELDALRGGEQLIRRSRPIILIEVSNANKGRFFGWLARMNYRTHRAFELVHASNYLLVPETLRMDFYVNGLVKPVSRTPAVPLAPEQSLLGWSAQEFLQSYSDTPVLELTFELRPLFFGKPACRARLPCHPAAR